MTDIRFYHVTKTPLERALPQLLTKLLEAGHRAVLLFEDEETLRLLDSTIWTWKQQEFLPHGTMDDAFKDQQLLYLTLKEENPNNSDAIVVIGNIQPQTLDSYKLCIDMFDGMNDNAVQSARTRWKDYKAASKTLTYFKQDDAGKWQKEATAA